MSHELRTPLNAIESWQFHGSGLRMSFPILWLHVDDLY
jgi:signal transduction histidine kinase